MGDQNNIMEHDLDCLKIPQSLPLQSIAHDYASSDSEDEQLNDKEDGNVETHEVNAMSIQSGGENSYICEDFHERNNNNDFSYDPSLESDNEESSEEISSDDDENDMIGSSPITRSKVVMPPMNNLAIDKKCILKIHLDSLKQIKDAEMGVIELSSTEDEDDDDTVINVAENVTTISCMNDKQDEQKRIQNVNVKAIKRKKCFVKIKKLSVCSLDGVCVGHMEDRRNSRVPEVDFKKYGGPEESLAKIGAREIKDKDDESLASKEGKDKKENLNRGRVSVTDFKTILKDSLQSFSISSSGLGLIDNDTEDDDDDSDAVIIEETYPGNVPGFEFQPKYCIDSSPTSSNIVFESSSNDTDSKDRQETGEEGDTTQRSVERVFDMSASNRCNNRSIGSRQESIVKEYVPDSSHNNLLHERSNNSESAVELGIKNLTDTTSRNDTNKINDDENLNFKETNEGVKTNIDVSSKGNEVSQGAVSNNLHRNYLKDLKGNPNQSTGDALITCSLNFKIPKIKAKKDPGNPNKSTVDEMTNVESLEGLSMKTFLEQEDIVPQYRLFGIADRELFDSMYDQVNAIKNSSSKKVVEVTEDIEKSDIDNEGWDILKCMQTDEERKTWVQDQFKNSVPSNPSINLTNHGFRRLVRKAININSTSCGEASSRQRGIKRKLLDVEVPETQPPKMIKLSDFGSYMKSVFFTKFSRKLGPRKASTADVKAFKIYIGHYKGGLEETSNFLYFYNPSKELTEEQVKEVVDLENQFSTFSTYYGEAEDVFCKLCMERHKFCQ